MRDSALIYVVLGGAVLVGGFLVLFVGIAMWEKMFLAGDVEPVGESLPYTPSPYWLATRDAAQRQGLEFGGDFATKKHTTLVKGLDSLWISRDRCIITSIFVGSFGGSTLKKTVLRTRLADGHILDSTDSPLTMDVGGTVLRAVLLNAGMAELLSFHVGRIAKSDSQVVPFSEKTVLECYECTELDRGAGLVSKGLARWIDPGHTVIRLTFSGAIRTMWASLFRSSAKLMSQASRSEIPRAGTYRE